MSADDKSAQMLLFHVMKLVQRSTNEDYSDAEYVEDFLLAYRDFLSPLQLLSLIKSRYNYEEPLPDDATEAEVSQFSLSILFTSSLLTVVVVIGCGCEAQAQSHSAAHHYFCESVDQQVPGGL